MKSRYFETLLFVGAVQFFSKLRIDWLSGYNDMCFDNKHCIIIKKCKPLISMLLYYLTAIKGNVAFKFWNFFQSKQISILTDNDAIIYFFFKLKINFNIECVYRINNRSIKIFALAQRCRGAPSSSVSRINWNVGMLFFRWKEETLAENAKKNDRTGTRREQKKNSTH